MPFAIHSHALRYYSLHAGCLAGTTGHVNKTVHSANRVASWRLKNECGLELIER